MRADLDNFLSTYISRYSTFDGYWVFGFIVNNLEILEIDLLSPKKPENDIALGIAHNLASCKFMEQLRKSGLNISCVTRASVILSKSSAMRLCIVEDSHRAGFDVTFKAWAFTDDGKRYECSDTVFVAPHDPKLERRSAGSLNASTPQDPEN
jgi:hypothetical protein